MIRTEAQFKEQQETCFSIFEKKAKDYGTSWRILRSSSLTDQIFIKAKRIRSIEENGEQKVEDDIIEDYIGLVNYSVMGIIQVRRGTAIEELSIEKVCDMHNHVMNITLELMKKKNHDYGEAWRDMRISSLTDLILMKILRIKQIEDNDGQTIISEGLEANYQDIINYSLFAMIRLKESR